MSEEVVIIVPEIAPGSGGLGDYTRRVVEQWRVETPLRFIVPESDGEPASAPGFNVDFVARNRAALRDKLPSRGGKVLLQYSAYGFDRFGYPRWFLQALTDWKAESGGLLVVMLHEIWTFWPVLNKNYLIQQLHRRDLRTLIASADSLFTTTASQAEHLRELHPQVVAQVIPVGANITPSGELRGIREPGLAVLFGLQGARLRALRLMQAELKSLASAAVLTKLVTVGRGNTTEGTEEERTLLRSLPLRHGTEAAGSLATSEVSSLLARASFGISAPDELSLTKSGTFMALAAHGLNVLSPIADTNKAEPFCWLIRPAELLRGISTDALQLRAQKLRSWQEQTSSWPAIAARFAAALSL